jgi:hypothetical protein
MAFLLVETDVFEATRLSIAVVSSVALVAVLGALVASVKAYFRILKLRREKIQQWLQIEHELKLENLSTSSELTIQRKDSKRTIQLPQHYTSKAADELLELLVH